LLRRIRQILFISSALLLAWLWMQGVHELGHCIGAWATGGSVEKVVLHPLAISRTDIAPNPHPLVVVWAGPVAGSLLPLAVWGSLLVSRVQLTWLTQFFAGFCLLSNGLYIGVGSLGGVGDAGDMLRLGSPIWLLWLFGLATAPWGLMLWNGLGPMFGFGPGTPPVEQHVTYRCVIALALTIIVEVCLSPAF
jgi:hypothetical protein